MLWGCLSASGTGNLLKVQGIKEREVYVKTERKSLRPSLSKLGLGHRFLFQHNSKHTSVLVKNFFQKTKDNVIAWAAQSCELNPTKSLCGELKPYQKAIKSARA